MSGKRTCGRDPIRWAYLALLAAVAALALVACTHDTASAPETTESTSEALTLTAKSLQVTPPTTKIPVTVSAQLKATVVYTNNSKKTLTSGVAWSVSDPTVASVSSNGLVTALKPGTVTVTAKDTADKVSGTAALTVTAATLVSVSVTPAIRVLSSVGTSVTFTATGVFSDGSHSPLAGAVTWTSTNAAIATVSATGKATAVAGGTVAITATHTATGLHGKATLTVGTATLSSIAITPVAKSIPNGLTQAFVATGTYSNGTTMDLTTVATWASASAAVASISNAAGTEGIATAASVGTTKITATVGAKKASTTLTVTAAVLASIAVTPATKNVPSGTTQQLTATGTYTDHTTHDLTAAVLWTSSSPGLVVSNATGSNGLATAMTPLGPATVTAMLGTISGTATLQVTAAVLRSISVTPPSPSLPLGLPQAFTATGTYSDASTQDITAWVTWSTGSAAVATISNASTPPAGIATTAGVGSTTVIAFDPTSGITGTATLNVTAAALTSVAISPPGATVANGLQQPFMAMGTYTDHSQKDLTQLVTWSVQAPGLATISNAAGSQGLASTGFVGANTILALEPTSGLTAIAVLRVTAAVLTSISVTPALQSIALGTTQQFAATGVFTDHTTQDLTSAVTWSATNGDPVSNVAPNGLVTAAILGPATITATYGSVSGSTTLTVTPAALVSIALTPPSPTFPAGFTQQFAATGTYTDNSTQDLTQTSTWMSTSSNVFSISGAAPIGFGSALAPGSVTLSATDPATGITGSTTVTVTPAILVSLAITPATATMPLGTTQQLSVTGTYSDKSKQMLSSTVTWTWLSSNGGIVYVSSAGSATAMGVGTVTVTATDPASGIARGMTINVTAAALVSIAVSPATQSVARGLTQQFTAKGTYTDGTMQDVTQGLTWSSSGPSATISSAAGSQGLATAASLGAATITAVDPATMIQGTATITTTNAALVSISVTPPSPSIPAGLTTPLTATGTYTDGSTLNLTSTVMWTATGGVSVSNATGTWGLVTALDASIGGGNVIATDPATSILGGASVRVTAAIVVSLSVVPVTVSLLTGQTHQLTATATMSDGAIVDHTGAVTWASSAASVYAANNGLVTGVSIGGATITATDPATNVSATATVAVSLNTTDSAAQEFSAYVNPVGNWAFGEVSGGTFSVDTTTSRDSQGDNLWVGSASNIVGNPNPYETGVRGSGFLPPGGIALEPTAESPKASARWTAPVAGTYSVNATFSGASDNYVYVANSSCTRWDQCYACTPRCHGCFIGQCWCGDNYCDGGNWYDCNPHAGVCYSWTLQNTTTDVSVLDNGRPIFSGTVNLNGAGNMQSLSTNVTVNAGDTLDFAAGNGDGTDVGAPGCLMWNYPIGGCDGYNDTARNNTHCWYSSTPVCTAPGTPGYTDATLLSAQVTAQATCASLNPPGLGNLVGLKLSPTAANVSGPGTTPFHALAYYSNQPATAVDVTTQAMWTASGSDLTVDAGGKVGYSGTVFATGSVNATFGALSASAAVRVWDPARLAQMQSLAISSTAFGPPSNLWYPNHGSCTTVTATAMYSDSTTEDVTATTLWSGDEPVLFGNLLVLNQATGYRTFDATLGAGLPSTSQLLYVGGTPFNSTCTDARIPGAAWKVTVYPGNGSLFVGQTAQLTAQSYFADGSVRDVSAQATWLSCNEAVADVASDGWITATSIGATTAFAAVGMQGGGGAFTVVPATSTGNLTSLFIQPTANNLIRGASFPARAVATYDNLPGYMFNVTPQTTWSAMDGAIVGIPPSISGPTNTTTANGIGTVKVIASFGGRATSEAVRVWDPARLAQLTSTALTPVNVNPTCLGEQLQLVASFSDGTTADVTSSTQWSPIGDSGWGFLSLGGYFTLEGQRQGYATVTGSMGRGIDVPRSSQIGVFGACPGPQCTDGVKDGYETDIDCGGPACGACPSGAACNWPNDCQTTACMGGVCGASNCADGIKDGAETGVDCGGGSCPACANDKGCLVDQDCSSTACSAVSFTCVTTQCADSKLDGAETDVDCGGGTCAACARGKRCQINFDCLSLLCNAQICQ